MSGASPRICLTRFENSREAQEARLLLFWALAALAHHAGELGPVDVVDGAEALDQLALLGRGDDADAVGARRGAQLRREHAETARGAPDQDPLAGLQFAARDQHAVGGEVDEAVGGRLRPAQGLWLGQELLGLDLGELGERAPGRLIAPDLLRGRRHRVEAVHLGILIGSLITVHHDLVARPPARDAGSDLPDDPGGVRAADVVAVLGMIAVLHHRHGLAQGGPHVVVVDPGGHHPHDHLERGGLGNLDLLKLESVLGFALALLPDDPCGHRGRQLAGLGVDLGDSLQIDCHGALEPRV